MEADNVDNTETITFMEWCAGYGGIGLGLKRVFGERLRTIAYCELEGYAQANLISKMEKGLLDVAPIWTDVKTFPCQEFHGLVDILSAGYPCQPFSMAGKRLGEDDPRHLWPFIQRAIATIQPRFCFFENVRGHLTLGFKNICHELGELGYDVVAGLFSAAEVGASHNRERLYILAHASSIRNTRPKYQFQVVNENRQRRENIKENSDMVFPAPPFSPRRSWEPKITIKPGVGGKVNGSDTTLDRLRLCGNGVVPQTAELAFRTLYKELIDN